MLLNFNKIPTLSDQELFELIANWNHEEAFDEIFRRHYASLCLYAMRFINDQHSAEDVVQELFVKFWERRNELQINVSVQSYLYKSTYHASLNYLRGKKVRGSYQANVQSESVELSDTTDSMIQGELEYRIESEINDLPSRTQEIFKLNRFENKKYREIAQDLNISIKTVEAHMSKALRTLTLNLAEYLPVLFVYLSLY